MVKEYHRFATIWTHIGLQKSTGGGKTLSSQKVTIQEGIPCKSEMEQLEWKIEGEKKLEK